MATNSAAAIAAQHRVPVTRNGSSLEMVGYELAAALASWLRSNDVVATVVHGDFEWDDAKAERNLAKHGVAFEEAVLAMKDPLSLDFEDLVEPANLITLAATPEGRILYIVSTERDGRLRLISARDASTHERRRYEETE